MYIYGNKDIYQERYIPLKTYIYNERGSDIESDIEIHIYIYAYKYL